MSERVVTTTGVAGNELRRPRQGSLARQQERLGWIMVTPAIIVFILVALYPMAKTFYNSLTDAKLGSARTVHMVGLDNYVSLLQDDVFLQALINTIYFAVVSVAFELLLGLCIALVVNSAFKGRGLVRTAMLVPWAIPTIVSAQMWKWMYNDVFGVINDFLVRKVHILAQPVAFLSQSGLAMNSIIAVDVWKTTPFMALLLLAGLQVISDDLYEAASIDRANRWQQFWYITLPLLRPAILVALIFRTIDALRVFDIIYVMTSGAAGTESINVYNYRNLIEFQKLGYGSTISVAIFAIIMVFVVIYVSIVRVEEG